MNDFLLTSNPAGAASVREKQFSAFLRYVVDTYSGTDDGVFGRQFCASVAQTCLLQDECNMLSIYLAIQHAVWILTNSTTSSGSG